jgi:hypothetical protein
MKTLKGFIVLPKNQGLYLLWLGTVLLRFCLVLAAFPALLFFLHLSIQAWYFPVITVTILAWAFFDGFKLFPDRLGAIISGILLSIIVIGLCLAIASWSFDISHDGRYYHLFAIQLLKSGWNPVYDPSTAAPGFDPAWMNWVHFYPKASWEAGAVLYSFFGVSEAAKAPNFILMLAVFLVAAGNLLRFARLAGWQVTLLSLAVALNPVLITQLFTKYNDGQVSACITIVIIALVSVFFVIDRLNLMALCAAIIYGSDLKSSAFFYFGIFVAISLLIYFLFGRNWRRFWIIGTAGILSAIVAIFVVGYNPYVTNWVLYRNPIYPLTVSNQDTIMTINRPLDFAWDDRFTRFAKSILAPSSNAAGKIKSPPPKIPFTVSSDELYILRVADTRTGGFGPWFSGIIAVTGLCWILLLVKKRKAALIALLLIISILVTIFATGEGWWARYAPQTWILPLLVVLSLWWKPVSKIQNACALILAFTILVNITMVAASNWSSNIQESSSMHAVMSDIEKRDHTSLVYCTSYCEAVVNAFQDHQVPIEIVSSYDKLPCPRSIYGVYISPDHCDQ